MSEEPHWPVAKWAVPRFWKFNEGRAGAGAKTPVSAAAQQPGGQGLGITHPLEALGSIPGGVVTTVGGTLGALLSNWLTRGGIKNVKNFRDVIGPKVEEKIREIMRRGDRELLGLNRASEVVDKPPVVMVLSGKDGEQQPSLLAYGEAIPELLYGMVQGAEMFSAPMQVSLSQDSKGNIFLGRPGRDEGTTLPMTSDVMWLRQMASYSFVDKNIGAAHHGSEPVTVAAVTLPVNERGDILVTQRASRGGMYNGLWVFPGGHVDGGERLADAAVREVREETGIDVRESSLRPVAIWEGAVSTRRKQFCVVFYAADATCENPLECTMQLQTKEVHRAVWVPREYVPRLLDTHVMHKDLPLHGILVEPDGSQVDVEVPLSEIQGGLGGGHKFALQKFLHGNPTYQKDDIKRSFSTKGRLETEEEAVWLDQAPNTLAHLFMNSGLGPKSGKTSSQLGGAPSEHIFVIYVMARPPPPYVW
eukprot:CAMPEP_0206278970 /NCGR_PEP_ID=MMETSP0047_2-20121206/37752_1 /ASSEMBLY_ACC=CAM_ASM_000192 /TAXON_ID=195065 /ORGANISM="Chroomonas mesostigmatica_cf, Strain CCMP1168" /LENGTH=474 /DNA_ID=CAMNT_0053708847 /DNA_START=18 /DNA_END=1443 /DNA_ORIENTATION=-